MANQVQKLWRDVGDEELEGIVTPSLGTKHVPLKHADSVRRFHENLTRNNIATPVARTTVSVDGLKCVHIADVAKNDPDSEYGFTIGFVNYNDKSKCWTGLAGTRHNDGMVFTSTHIPESRRKHTISLLNVVDDKIDSTVDMFKKYMIQRQVEIEYLKSVDVDDDMIARLLLGLHRDNSAARLCSYDIERVVTLWDDPPREDFKPRTVWTLHKVFAFVTNPTPNPLRRIEALENAINIARAALKLD